MTLAKQIVRLMALIVVVLGMLAPLAVLYAQGGGEVGPDAPQTGELDSQTFARTFWFEAVAGQTVALEAVTTDDGLALALLLVDADGALLAQDTDADGSGIVSIVDYVAPETGRYYVTVMRLSGAEGDAAGKFTLTYAVGAVPAAEAALPRFSAPTLVTLDGMKVSVSWNSTANIDLEVRDPYGNSIYWENPTVDNAVFDRDVNANCVEPIGDNPTETITWTPGAVPSGSYEVLIYYVQGCENNDPVNLKLDVTAGGTPLEPVSGTLLPDQVFLSSFRLAAGGELSQGVSGIYPGATLRNSASFLTGQTPIAAGVGATGVISAEQPFAAYSFDGKTGDIVSIRMDSVAGSLDAALYLLDPSGNVVAYNDDAPGEDATNSAINNQTLVSDGVYTIVASRYGQEFGGTEGEFTLTLTGAEFSIPPALAGLNLPGGSVEVSLLWNTNADLQLLVRDPSGSAVYDDIPVVTSGGVLAENGNVNCANTSTSPVSYIYWPEDRLPPGTYEVEVWYQNSCNDTSPVTFNLTVRVNGEVIIASTAQPIPGQVYLTSFTVDVNGFAAASAGGILGDSSVLDIGSLLPGAISISYGDTVSGTINQANKVVLYTFEGEAGDQVRIGMDATAGTLDTSLFLLSPEGAQLAFNDDAVLNETMNSLIDNFTLPADGTYIIVASHYGLIYGGTSGTYNLSVVRLN